MTLLLAEVTVHIAVFNKHALVPLLLVFKIDFGVNEVSVVWTFSCCSSDVLSGLVVE